MYTNKYKGINAKAATDLLLLAEVLWAMENPLPRDEDDEEDEEDED